MKPLVHFFKDFQTESLATRISLPKCIVRIPELHDFTCVNYLPYAINKYTHRAPVLLYKGERCPLDYDKRTQKYKDEKLLNVTLNYYYATPLGVVNYRKLCSPRTNTKILNYWGFYTEHDDFDVTLTKERYMDCSMHQPELHQEELKEIAAKLTALYSPKP